MTQDVTARLAARLAELRRARGLTLDQLAAQSGVSRAALSRLENAEVSPSLDVLARLAQAHDMSLSRLAALAEDGFSAHIPRDAQPVLKGEGRSVVERLVSPGALGLAGTVTELRFPPGTDWTEAVAPTIGQEQHVIMLNGEASLQSGAAEFALVAGDCLRLQAQAPLRINTQAGQRAKLLLVRITP